MAPRNGGPFTISGNNFVAPLEVLLASVPVEFEIINENSIVAQVQAGVGIYNIEITHGTSGCSKSTSGTWSYVVPEIHSTSPISIHGGNITVSFYLFYLKQSLKQSELTP